MTGTAPHNSPSWDIPPDIAELSALCGAEVICDLLQTFLDDTPGRFARLRVGIASGDAKVVTREGHTIKGGSAQMGAHTLAAIASRLESGGGQPQLWLPLLEECETEFAQVSALIRAHLLAAR